MRGIIDKVKEKSKDNKDTVVDTTKDVADTSKDTVNSASVFTSLQGSKFE